MNQEPRSTAGGQPPFEPQSNNSNPGESPETPRIHDPYAGVVSSAAFAPPKKSRKKKVLLFCAAVVLLLGIGAGAVFGFYLPNTPANVWKTGLNRSGEALGSVVTSATEKDKLDAFKKSQINASVTFNHSAATYSGTFAAKFDDKKSDGSLDISVAEKDMPAKQVSLKYLSELKDGSLYPNIYFQVTGLKAIGGEELEAFVPGISEFDGKWIGIDAEYLKSLGLPAEEAKPDEQNKEQSITADEISELARTVTNTVNEYILTANPDKAIFEQRKFVGKETVDGVKAYRYQVGMNKQHAKDFCKAIIERMAATKIAKKVPGYSEQNAARQVEESIKSCQTSADEDIKQDYTFDMWIDAKYKLIYKIRATSPDDKDVYTDIGQIYKGGDELSFFLNTHDGKNQSESKATVETNIKTNQTKANFTFKSTKQDNPFDMTLSLDAKPFTEEIKIEKPAGTVPVQDVLQRLGIDPSAIGSPLWGLSSLSSEGREPQLDQPTYTF